MPRLLLGPLRLVGALLTSVLVGALTAALVLPLVAGVGLRARDTAQEYLVLPTDLEVPELARRSRILAADGSLIAWLYLENRVPVTLDQSPSTRSRRSSRSRTAASTSTRAWTSRGWRARRSPTRAPATWSRARRR